LTRGTIRKTKQHHGAWLLACLLLLVTALLWSGGPHAAASAASQGATSAAKSVRVTAQAAALAASRPTAEVPRSPLLARLAVTWLEATPSIRRLTGSVDRELSCDRRRELRRVQTRRRVPRMNSEEPPWC
jgi:hypothetical protein